MNAEIEAALLKALTSIAEGQKELVKEIKSLKADVDSGDLVPIKMPDGSTGYAKKSSLQASTQAAHTGKMTVVESPPMPRDPWPDPSIPKPPIVR
jgi:hypothetical protein